MTEPLGTMQMNETELRELDAWIAVNVFKSIRVEKESPRRWKVRYELDVLPSGVGCGGFKSEQEAYDYLWYQIKHPTTSPADAMRVLEKCIEHGGDVEVGRAFFHGEELYRVRDGMMGDIFEKAPTLPLTICLFARKLFSK